MMKKRLNLVIAIVMILTCFLFNTTVFAVEEGTIVQENNEIIRVSMENAVEIPSIELNTAYFLEDRTLTKIEYAKPNSSISYVDSNGEFEKTFGLDIDIYSIDVTEEERTALLNGSIQPMSSNLTKTDQANGSGNILATLTVKYARPIQNDGTKALHLCKATGSYERTGSIEGVYPETSNLYWHCYGRKYINGIDQGLTLGEGFNRNYSTPTFSNIQLMSESLAMLPVSGGAGVNYTIYCSRGVEIEVAMPF